MDMKRDFTMIINAMDDMVDDDDTNDENND